MRTTKAASKTSYLSARADVLLAELEEQCQETLKLLAQLETPGLGEEQVETILGELSACVLHLHEHTRGLDRTIDGTRVKREAVAPRRASGISPDAMPNRRARTPGTTVRSATFT
jgi:hypothetical protein